MKFLFSFCLIVVNLVNLTNCQFSKPYDYYLFQLTWPTTFCTHASCDVRPPNHFVIHGNWPNRYDQKLVTYCYQDHVVDDLGALNPIRNELSSVWPALKGGDHQNFWFYQWKKHGACATETPALVGVRNFFGTTLNMYKRLSLDAAMKSLNFVPTQRPRPYPTRRFFDALKSYYKAAPYIKCRRGSNGISLLENISFCFDKQLNLIDCSQRTQCNSEFLFPFPG